MSNRHITPDDPRGIVFRCKGRNGRQWRLFRDGTIERTSKASIYRPIRAVETPPKELLGYAIMHDIPISSMLFARVDAASLLEAIASECRLERY